MKMQKPSLNVTSLSFSRNQNYYEAQSFKNKFIDLLINFNKPQKLYRDQILKNISFKIQPGESVALVGPNGSGKSTLLKVLSQKYRLQSGEIFTEGSIQLFQNFENTFYDELTGLENLRLACALLYKNNFNSAVDYGCAFSELDTALNRRVETYSAGMKSRLALAVMSFELADITFFDEVCGYVDSSFKEKFFKQIKSFENKTTLWTSHHILDLKQIAQRALVIDKGQIVFDGSLDKSIGLHYLLQKNIPQEVYAE